MSGSTLLSSVYGYEVSSSNDGLVKTVESAVHRISEAALAGSKYLHRVSQIDMSNHQLRFLREYYPLAKVCAVLAPRCQMEAHGERMAERD